LTDREYLTLDSVAGMSKVQMVILDAIRTLLGSLSPAGVDPGQTTAWFETLPNDLPGVELRLRIPHVADPEVRIDLRVDPWGEIGLWSEPLGDFGRSFNQLWEPWDSCGDTGDALETLRALLEGRVEVRIRRFGQRLIKTKTVEIDEDGRRRQRGAYYRVPNVHLSLVPGRRTEVIRPHYLDSRSPSSSVTGTVEHPSPVRVGLGDDGSLVDELRQTARGADPREARMAVHGLAALGSEEELRGLAADTSLPGHLRADAICGLGWGRTEVSLELLGRMREDRERVIRRAAKRALSTRRRMRKVEAG
jgi:hypothetical protein